MSAWCRLASPIRRSPGRCVLAAALLLLVLSLSGCAGPGSQEPEIWIYTSVYKEIYPLFEPGLEEAFPGVSFHFYQSGSEKIAAKILAEEQGGGSRADLLMTSDLFFYEELAKEGRLLPLSGLQVPGLGAELRQPEDLYWVQRYPVMVLAYNRQMLRPEDAPKGWADLLDPRFAGQLTMPSPLESGSALTSILYLYQRFGEDYFSGLRRNEVLAAGGNGSTLSRLQSGERPVGMVLMENLLQAEAKGMDSVAMVLPEEGALTIPSPLAVLANSDQPELARRVAAWFFSPQARQVVIQGWMYTPFADDAAPTGAPAWQDFQRLPWDLETFAEWTNTRQEVKTLFRQIVLD